MNCPLTFYIDRKEGQNHLMTVNSTGTAVAGSKSNVVDAIKQGHHVRVSSLTSSPGNKYKYSYQCDALEQSANESLGVCTALWSVSQRTVVKDGHQIKDFQVCCTCV